MVRRADSATLLSISSAVAVAGAITFFAMVPAGAQQSSEGEAGVAGPANRVQLTQAEVDEAQQRLSEIQGRVADSYADYEESLGELESLNAEISSTGEDLISAERELIEAQNDLDGLAERVYRSGNVGFVDILVDVENFSDFAARMQLWVKVLTQQQAEVNRVQSIRDTLAVEQDNLDAQREQRAQAVEQAAAERNEASELEAETMEYLTSLDGELRAAAEAQAFAEEAAREDQRRIIAARESAIAASIEAQAEEAANQAEAQRAAAAEAAEAQAAAEEEAARKAELAEERAAARAELAEQQEAAEEADRRAELAEQMEAERAAAAEAAEAQAAAEEEAARKAELAAQEEAAARIAAEQAEANRAAAERAAAQQAEADRVAAEQAAAEQQAAEEQYAAQQAAAEQAAAQQAAAEEQAAADQAAAEAAEAQRIADQDAAEQAAADQAAAEAAEAQRIANEAAAADEASASDQTGAADPSGAAPPADSGNTPDATQYTEEEAPVTDETVTEPDTSGGGNLTGTGASADGPWQPHVAQVANEVSQRFGVPATTYPGHSPSEDLAIDFMTYENTALGQQIADYLAANIDGYGISYIMFNDEFYSTFTNYNGPAYTWVYWGDGAHYDHVHVSFPG